MGTTEKPTRRSRARWRAVIARAERSPLGVAAFCRTAGISTASFYAWRRRLADGAPSETPAPVGEPASLGLLLRGIKREDVERGQVVCKPGSVTPHTEFEAAVYILSKDEGGRHTPFFNNYRPQFYFRTTDVTGVVTLPEGTEMVMPGDNTNMKVDMIQPIAMEEGLRFAIREGGRTVGAGRVTKIIK